MARIRLDTHIATLYPEFSKSQIQGFIMAGKVVSENKKLDKPGMLINPDTMQVRMLMPDHSYVSRAALKLSKAKEYFGIDFTDTVVLDIGSSTGGFTEVALQNGARKVIAIDSGTNQMAYKLRIDTRVELFEQTNARYLDTKRMSEPADILVMDVSFISVSLLFPGLYALMKNNGYAVILIKPQFELGKTTMKNQRGGVVRDESLHKEAIDKVWEASQTAGFIPKEVIESPITGGDGNKEFLLLACKFT